MVRGHPDWGQPEDREAVHHVTDLGELAARLGSIDTFSRSGDVLLLDGFESGLGAWEKETAGVGATVALSADIVRSGGYSCELKTAASTNSYAKIERGIGYPYLSKWGLEFSFSTQTRDWYLDVDMALDDASDLRTFRVRYNLDAQTLAVLGPDGNYTTFATDVNIYASHYRYQTLKLVVDLVNMVYSKFSLNEKSYTLTSYSPPTGVTGGVPFFEPRILINPTANAVQTMYVDDFILTQNEP